jgi:cytochrome c nitrite reductase small subunit
MRGIGRWLPWAACVSVGVLAGVGLYTFQYAKGLSYLSDDPAACVNCHIMRDQYDSWVRSSHHAVAGCNDCHVPHGFPQKYLVKMDNGWSHSKKFTLQSFQEPIRIRPRNLAVLQRNCLHCHSALVHDIAGHRDLARGEVRCTSCHRSVGHMALD